MRKEEKRMLQKRINRLLNRNWPSRAVIVELLCYIALFTLQEVTENE